ncbi:hypothetical protein [Palleronia sp. LCG004]|uniref:hypothetical protein n=1 Tax=Palleronia sp. LCG004 TaxID=3079304 RepID=UPI002942513C|nr:hypothetical protein [Palleronia sp. LCG004]WOI56588.1 hypothetical protein RVY76_01965 [Palleronia sp. LCG004]
MYDDGTGGGLSAGGAILLLSIGIYVTILWQAGKALERHGYALAGTRLCTISVSSVLMGFMGGLAGGAFIVLVLGGYSNPAAMRVHWLAIFIGWAKGVLDGWRKPIS